MGVRLLRVIPALIVSLLLFQNCSGVGFNSPQSGSSQNSPGPAAPAASGDAFSQIEQGLIGGHFDLDTSSQLYPPSQGKTDHHVHQYDDKYNVTYADYFNLLDGKFGNINEIVAPSDRFTLVILNAQLSRGGVVSINGQDSNVFDYQNKADNSIYTLDGSAGIKLSSLRIGFKPDVLAAGGLIGTDTSCVVRNDPGKLGEPRNGALIIRAMSLTGDLLWESTLFWHWDNGCYK